jgi:triosephosphate isomerase
MNKKQFLIVGNWKMNPMTMREAKALFAALAKKSGTFGRVEVVVAPPFPHLPLVQATKKIQLGAQDVFWEPVGSFTGEISAPMLRDVGVSYVILGHSERRRYMLETDEIVNRKLKYILATKLRPIVCVGEQKRDSEGAFFGELRRQIEATFSKLKKQDLARFTVAYEPVWAIGSGKPARPEDANEAALFIKKVLANLYGVSAARRVKVIYGGSVDAKNASLFLKEQEVSGLLVGRESLKPQEFLGIIQCARSIS